MVTSQTTPARSRCYEETKMRKLRMLLVAVVAAVPLAPVGAQASHPECEGEGCPPPHQCTIVTCPWMCQADLPVEIGPDVIYFHDRPLLGWVKDCQLV